MGRRPPRPVAFDAYVEEDRQAQEQRPQEARQPRHQAQRRALSPSPVPSRPSKDLVTVPNPEPGRDYEVRCETDELTCLCPVTGQPDFATVRISYVPDELLVELKSLKMYLWSYRDEGAFHEAVTNRILDDLVGATGPRRMTVETIWKVRGGITTTVTASHPS
jgi:7-cyano-7-deazaguanine reductase